MQKCNEKKKILESKRKESLSIRGLVTFPPTSSGSFRFASNVIKKCKL